MSEIKIVKRDGTITDFDGKKIYNALKKAFISVEGIKSNIDDILTLDKNIEEVVSNVSNEIQKKIGRTKEVYIEDIQDMVELNLMRVGHYDVAKNYVIYRSERTKQREIISDIEKQAGAKMFSMKVVKRNGVEQAVSLDKITNRVAILSKGLNVDPIYIAQKAISGLYNGILTEEIDQFLSETSASLTTDHPDYSIIASRIKVNALHKETESFVGATKVLYNDGLLNDEYYNKVIEHGDVIEKIINYDKDYSFDYFALTTLIRAYLLKVDGKIIERPQDMFMRTALTVVGKDFDKDKLIETYELISSGYYTHATPTLFNSGLKMQQLSSCFLISMEDDSIEGIFNTLKDTALISKTAGGIGLHVHNIRGQGSIIKSTNGRSNGLIPFLKIFNETARSVDQGGGKRKGSFAIYIEPWHKDIEEFLELRKNTGADEFRARDLFYALWIPDLFMERVEQDGDWTLMSEYECPGLSDLYGDEFKKLYESYEASMPDLKKIKARSLMSKIIEAQIEAGQPYMLYKDSINEKSNQKNIGVIKSSNLCAEIVEYSDKNETAVCNLASISLPHYVEKDGTYNYKKLYEVSKVALRNLNNVIDVNFYPTDKTERSNMRHRPVALGVQGLADVFFKMKIPYESDIAKDINIKIFETIYFACLECSNEIAKEEGAYSTFDGSPLSQGKFQFDMWGQNHTGTWDFEGLRKKIMESGVRNSLVTACMPTASTGIILGNTETFQIQSSNIYKRQTLSGEFMIVNRYLVQHLEELNLWNKDIRDKIIVNNGSIQEIEEIPADIKEVYKTVYECSQKTVIDMAADRGPFIDQTQSMNLFMANPTFGKINSMHMYSWKKGLKTGMYYLRSKSAVDAVKMTVAGNNKAREIVEEKEEECLSCGA